MVGGKVSGGKEKERVITTKRDERKKKRKERDRGKDGESKDSTEGERIDGGGETE